MPQVVVKRALKTQAPSHDGATPAGEGGYQGRPLITRNGILAGILAMVAAPFGSMPTSTDGLFNDFYTYWAAAKLLNAGRSPYDIGAITQVLHSAGITGLAGSGYSYPLFLAELLRPLALLPPSTAAAIFAVVSVLALGLAVALLAGSIPRLAADEAVWFGAVCGFVVPVSGSLYFGQANLLVLPLLALSYRAVASDWLIAAAALVKVYPATGFLAALTSTSGFRHKLLQTIPAAVLLGLLLLLAGGSGLNGNRSQLIGPDPFWSNQSVNGFVSRLAEPSAWTQPPFPMMPVEPAVILVSAVLVLWTLAVLLLSRRSDEGGRIALALWLGVLVAPKNSLWNYVPLVLLVAYLWPRLRSSRAAIAIAALGGLAIEEQAIINSNRSWLFRHALETWLSSLALYGALVLGVLGAYFLLHETRRRRAALRLSAVAASAVLLLACGGRDQPDDQAFHSAVTAGQGGTEVTFDATVSAPPYQAGDHERIEVTAKTGESVEIDHNVSLAQWVPAKPGDALVIHGQLYVDPGRVGVHCTHAATSSGCPTPGWIELGGNYYQ